MAAGKPLNVCMTFDFDAVCVWGEVFNQYTPTPMSRGEFGGRVAVPRILKLLRRHGVKATFFVPGHTIDTFPEVCKEIVADGHEVGRHGYFLEAPVTLEEAAEREILERGLAAMDTHLDGYRPAGYRSPAFDLSPNTTNLLREYGFRYDSSMMARDFEPYWSRTGDEIKRDRAFKFGPEIDLVEIPPSRTLGDMIQLEYMLSEKMLYPGVQNPKEIKERWLEDLSWAAEEGPGGVFTMTFHPQCIGRGARIRIVDHMIERAKELAAELVTPVEVADAWAKENDRG